MSTTTATDTKVLRSIYVVIERIVDTQTGWSYIDRVYSSFWDESHDCIRQTSYGFRITNDREAFEAVQDTLEDLGKEGYSWDDAQLILRHQTTTQIDSTYWEVIGKRI